MAQNSNAKPGCDLFPPQAWVEIARSLRLSARETQIVKGIFDDLKDLGIAEQLQISPHTVHTYIQRIYQKLSVASRAELIIRVVADYLHSQHVASSGGNGTHRRRTTTIAARMPLEREVGVGVAGK